MTRPAKHRKAKDVVDEKERVKALAHERYLSHESDIPLLHKLPDEGVDVEGDTLILLNAYLREFGQQRKNALTKGHNSVGILLF